MNEDQPSGNPWVKNLLIWGGIFLVLLSVVSLFNARGDAAATQLPYSDFRAKVAEGSVTSVEIGENKITGKLKTGETFSTVAVPNDTQLQPLLQDKGVKYQGKAPEQGSLIFALLFNILPFVLLIGLAFFAMRQLQKGGGSGAMGFGKSKAKMLTEKQGRITFADVAGIDEAREELEEIVEFLKDPHRFAKLGGQIPKGALLVGSPGTGKT
ncbi:MAG: ATP-dependent metallopeptidase FtsH/Yme1/Tma family protein, partial [Sphingomonadales bacterium]|nr:ATP-dependent metallopeptidase FtsH/Yme1/Tma family protein [Sphingomonadales bacterium]